MDRQRMPKPGEKYTHFKGKLYQIIAIAAHSETLEPMVVYQALYGDFKTYVRPYEMFVSVVDRVKYPEVKQKYRFELVNSQEEIFSLITENKISKEEKVTFPEERADGINPVLSEFLDAETYSKKMEVLATYRKELDDRLINDMAVALDCTVDEGPLEERIQGIITCLQTMCKFEDRRLR